MNIPEQLKDFRNFVYIVWDHLGLPEPTPVQYDVCKYLQHGPRRKMVAAFRGLGKSYLTSAYAVWRLLLDPEVKILVVSASKSRADDFSVFTQRLIWEMDILSHLRPKDAQRTSKIAFDVGPATAAHAPSVKSVGITGQLTGSRADLIIADDVESLGNSATQQMRDKLQELVKEFEAVLKPGGEINFLGTYQSEMSIYHQLPRRGYKTRVWPAKYPDEKLLRSYGELLAPTICEDMRKDAELVGQPTDPLRFNEWELAEREASYGRTGFQLQFMLDTSLSDADRYPLKLSDLIVTDVNIENAPEKVIWSSGPDYVHKHLPNVGFTGDRYYRPMAIQGDFIPYSGSVMAIDPSGRGTDETAYAVVKFLNGYLYVTDCGGVPGGYEEETLSKLVSIAKVNKVNMILIESNFGDGMFTSLLKPFVNREYRCAIEEVRHHIQKERRICDVMEPVMNQHKLLVDPKLIEADYNSTQHYSPDKALQYQLFYQISRITRDKGSLRHDDRLDVLSMAVQYWVEYMGKDADQAIRDRKEDLLEDALDNFMDHALGRPVQAPSWLPSRN